MLTVEKLLAVLQGLDPDAQVVVGIINGPRFNAADANPQVCGKAVVFGPEHHELRGEAPALYILCYEEPRPWEGQQPVDGTLEYDPNNEPPAGKGAA